MPLLQTAANIPDVGVVGSHPPKRVFLINAPLGVQEYPVSCFAAVIYWILTDNHNGTEPQHDANALLSATLAVRRMLTGAKKLTQQDAASLVPGSVIIFANNNSPGHSCIAIDSKTIVGYNQSGWFANGKVEDYSSHVLTQLSWGTKADAGKIIRSVGGAYELYQVSEMNAKAIVASY